MKKTESYLTPKTKVVEFESKTMLCTSDTKGSSTERFDIGDEIDA